MHCMLSFWPPRFDGCLSSVSLKPLTGNKSFEILTLIGPNYPTLNNVKGIFLPSYSLPLGLSYLCVYFFLGLCIYMCLCNSLWLGIDVDLYINPWVCDCSQNTCTRFSHVCAAVFVHLGIKFVLNFTGWGLLNILSSKLIG